MKLPSPSRPPASANAPSGSPLRAWSALALIAVGVAVAQAFGRFTYGVLLPAIRDDLGISNTVAGTISAVNVGGYLLGTLVVAWAASRIRLLELLRLGLALTAAGLVLAANAETPGVLMVALLLTGLGGAAVWIPAPIIAADAMPPEHRSIAVGLMGSGIGLGIVFTGFISAHVRTNYGDAGWTFVFWVDAVIACAALAGLLLIVRHRQGQTSSGGGFGGFGALRRMRGWLPLTLAYSAFGFMYLLIIGFLTTRLEDDSGWSASSAAYAFTLLGVAMVFGGPLSIWVMKRIGARQTISAVFALWSVLTLVVLGGSTTPTLIAVAGLGLLFTSLPGLVTLYVVENTNGNDYGPAYSAITLAFGVAQTISPQVGGLIADLSGSFSWVFVLSSAMGILGLVAARQLPADETSDRVVL